MSEIIMEILSYFINIHTSLFFMDKSRHSFSQWIFSCSNDNDRFSSWDNLFLYKRTIFPEQFSEANTDFNSSLSWNSCIIQNIYFSLIVLNQIITWFKLSMCNSGFFKCQCIPNWLFLYKLSNSHTFMTQSN